MNYEDLQAALAEFDLPPRVTRGRIRERHRQLVRRYHPDKVGGDGEEIRRVNAAYRVLKQYLDDYQFDFSREEFLEQNPEERLREQFWNAPPWGEV